jgi:hypothetical protein
MYRWRLEVAVWTTQRSVGEEAEQFRPRLLLTHQDQAEGQESLIGWIEYELRDYRKPAEGWNAHYMPPDAEDLGEARESTWYSHWGGRTLLSKGETKHPRDSAREAMDALVGLAKSHIPRAEHEALSRVGPMLLRPLQDVVATHVRRFPPPRAG